MPIRSEAARLQAAGRTDILGAAILRELDRHRQEIDSDDDLRTLSVTCRINRATGEPRVVIVSRESEHDYSHA